MKIFFYSIYESENDKIMFHREETVQLIDHFKKVYNLSIVGWFVNKNFDTEISTIHTIL